MVRRARSRGDQHVHYMTESGIPAVSERRYQMTRRTVGRPGVPAPVLLALLAMVSLGVLMAPGAARAATNGHSVGPHVYQGGGVIGFGDAAAPAGPASLPSVMVAMAVHPASTPADEGYWLAGADGSVYPVGNAASYGSLTSVRLQAPIVGMTSTPDGKGYWLTAIDGGIFAFGDAAFYGSMGGTPLNQPVVGMAPTPDGKGYWLVASDGGMFAFGDAPFYGSMGGQPLNDPVVAMVATPSGGGYLLVATDGGIFRFGSAPFYGSLGAGYGGNPADVPPVAGIAFTPDALGYWLLAPDGWSYSFSNPPDPSPSGTAAAIVSIANSQVNSDPDRGNFCNPYGPCEAWCALFATWVWQQAGIPIPSYPFTGNIYNWAAAHGQVLPPTATPWPGDAVLDGTGPSSASTSLHVGLVVQTWPDGAIVTIEGDAGPAPTGSLAVVINGPYLPSRSAIYNGMPIYAFAQP